ncbi:FkbM family methyltransferase [Deltaproteobacteria bacterium TL4]
MENMQSITNIIGSIIPRNLRYCDVGARWGIEEPWKSFRDNIDLISFEPDKVEYDILMKNKDSTDMIYSYALSSESKKVSLNLTKSRGCSSLYKPNHEFLKNYPDVGRFEIEDTVMVEATSLDALYNDKVFSDMDFIKLDVQGAALDILKGGEKFLSENIFGIQVEIEFQPMYENQPLFPDVDNFIRNRLGLRIQDLRKSYWKYPEGINIGSTKGQLVFGDALYFRSPQEVLSWCSDFHKNDASSKLQMACLMGIVYGYLDYSLCLLNQPSISDFLERDQISQWRALILHYGKSLNIYGKGTGRLSSVFNLLYRMFQPTHEGWSSIGHHLGTRKKLGIFR